LYEVAHRDDATAAEIASSLGFDAGYLSRILRRFEEQGLLTRTRSRDDARQSHLALTKKGRSTFATLETRARHDIGGLLEPLADDDQRRVTVAMGTIERLLDRRSAPSLAPLILRDPRPGDFGWVVQRHGALYAQEYGWDERFEGLVAGIVAGYIEHFDPKRERGWIAERDGENVGCVFLVKKSATVAKLRMLLVEPSARGTGLGKRLVAECERFAARPATAGSSSGLRAISPPPATSTPAPATASSPRADRELRTDTRVRDVGAGAEVGGASDLGLLSVPLSSKSIVFEARDRGTDSAPKARLDGSRWQARSAPPPVIGHPILRPGKGARAPPAPLPRLRRGRGGT